MSPETPPELIRQQLSRTLAAGPFQNSGVLSRFLTFIVEQTLEGKGPDLKEYTIGLKVLAKKPDFNPQADPIVRIHAGRLRRALQEYYEGAGKEDALIISIPKGSYVPAFSSDKKPISPPAEATIRTQKKVSIAVLPFAIMNRDEVTVSFADGLGDHISSELTRYSEISVISYFSSRRIIDRVTDIREAGLILDARYLLTGYVQRDENRLRILVQLILTETREQVWANTYEKQSTAANLFEIQDEIVWQVVSQTAGHYGAINRNTSKIPPQKNIKDLGIYDAIFWYYHFVTNISEEMFHTAEAAMQKAVEADPDYAMGWAVLGEIFIGGYFIGQKSRLVENQLEKAVAYGKRAIKIDPLCQHAYQTVALASLFLHKKADSLKTIEDWTKIKPAEAGIMGAMGFMLICCGDYERGMKMLDESVHLNPYYQWWLNGGFSFYYFHHGEYENSIYWMERMNMPSVPWELLMKTACYGEMGRIEEARKVASQMLSEFPFLNEGLSEYTGAFLQDEKILVRLKNAFDKVGIKIPPATNLEIL